MQFGYAYLIRLIFFKIQSNPVLNCRIRLDRDPQTGSCSTLVLTDRDEYGLGFVYKSYGFAVV